VPYYAERPCPAVRCCRALSVLHGKHHGGDSFWFQPAVDSVKAESREFTETQRATATSQSTTNLEAWETSTDGHAPRTSWRGRTGELQDADVVADAGQDRASRQAHDSRALIPCADYDCARWRVMRLPGAMEVCVLEV